MSAVFLQNKRKIIFKATFILNKIPILIKLPSFLSFLPYRKCVIDYAQFIGKGKKKSLSCFKSLSLAILRIETENWSKKRSARYFCSCAGQLGSAATVNVSGICEAKSQ